MTHTYRPLTRSVLSDGFTPFARHEYELRRRDGTWQTQDREVLERGHGACCLLYDPERAMIAMTQQFRIAVAVVNNDGMMIEAPAGHVDGIDAQSRMRAEVLEETGYRVGALHFVGSYYMSPGSISAYQSLFIAQVGESDRVSKGGGLVEEGEDIAVLHLTVDQALDMVSDGRITDGKTVILLQALALRLARGQDVFTDTP